MNAFYRLSCLAAILLLPFSLTDLGARESDTFQEDLLAPLPPLAPSGAKLDQVSWEESRRAELLELFQDHVYGRVPTLDVSMRSRVMFLDRQSLGGLAVMKEVQLDLLQGTDTVKVQVLVFLPADAEGPVPLFLGLNFYGNHTIHPDPSISLPESPLRINQSLGITSVHASDASRGLRASRWPVEAILSRGYGLATVYCGDLDPDQDDGFRNGVHRLDHSERDSSSWGTIAAWAWGLSRVLDYFEQDVEVDAGRVAVIGHSRLGKTALWAGATDQRFAMVISNNSGCGGAALSRRRVGESVERINASFPHWFADRFKDYSGKEAACPVDQHQLLALMAPRPLYVASATEDQWADPVGEYLSLYHGSKAYPLFGLDSLASPHPPGAGEKRWAAHVAYHLRSGKHDLTTWDWKHYLDFADLYLQAEDEAQSENPVSTEWLDAHLRHGHPRLVLNPELDQLLRQKLDAGDAGFAPGMACLQESADAILDLPLLEYRQEGRRLLGVSREALRRLSTLALAFRYGDKEEHLHRLEDELEAVCSFPHWNPSHFLDVGEMAAAVALAVDWAGQWMDQELLALARQALLEKAIKPGLAASATTFFKTADHNWNLVCNGGLALAALCLYEEEAELCSAILHQAVATMPLALKPYGPDGVYPEGVSYWSYATSYLALTVSAFESALDTDFGFLDAPGLEASVLFSLLMAGPSGEYYNFFDAGSGGYMELSHLGLQAWFEHRTPFVMNREAWEHLLSDEELGARQFRRSRLAPFFLIELAQLEAKKDVPTALPGAWVAAGNEAMGVLRDSPTGPGSFFLAAKAGCAADNHGNMDAGSFILEMEGVRWAVDPGNQSYHELEQLMGMELWQNGQESQRWSLLTKNNFGHSTLTVNRELHLADGRATLLGTDLRGPQPSFSFDLSPVFGASLQSAQRTFTRTGPRGLRIADRILASPNSHDLCWQLLTTAEVEILDRGFLLKQDGKTLYVECVSSLQVETRVQELSPPPLPHDKDIPGLKRLEFFIKELPEVAFTFSVELQIT